MKRPPDDFDIVSSGSLDRRTVQAQQRTAPGVPPRRQLVTPPILATLVALFQSDRDRWWTYGELQAATGYGEGVVRTACRRLLADQQVEHGILAKTTRQGPWRLLRAKR